MASNVGFGMAIGAEQISQAKEVGFKSIINISEDFSINVEMSQEAESRTIDYVYQPILELNDAVIDFAGKFNSLEKPILILGKTGDQAIELHLLAMQMDLLLN